MSTPEVIELINEVELETLSLIESKKSRYKESRKRASLKYQKKNAKEIYQKRKDQGKITQHASKEYMCDYYENNKEKYKLRNKEAYEKKKEDKDITYYELNKEKYKLRSKEAYQKKKEALLNTL